MGESIRILRSMVRKAVGISPALKFNLIFIFPAKQYLVRESFSHFDDL